MAQFRGVIRSNGNETTRLGQKKNGLTTEAQSYEGKIVVCLWYDESLDKDRVLIEAKQHEGQGTTKVLYDGLLEDV